MNWIVYLGIVIISKFNLFYSLLEKLWPDDASIYLTNLKIDSFSFQKHRKRGVLFLTLTLLFWPSLAYSGIYLLFVLLLTVLSYKLPYFKVKQRFQAEMKLLVYYFPIWLRQLQILMQNNTVFQALTISINQAPILFQPEITILVNKLKEDPLSYQAYQDFFGFYEIREIKKVMRLLYRYQTVGQKEAYLQLQRIIETTSSILNSKRTIYYQEWLDWHKWYGLLPLVAVTGVFLLLMFNVLMNFFTKGVLL